MARGRPRKVGAKRLPSGKTAEPTVAEIKQVARLQRVRARLMREADDPRHGGPLGILALEGFINEAEHQAGVLWEVLVRRYAGIMGIGLEPRVSASEAATRGRSASNPPPDHVIQRVRRDYNAAFESLSRRQLLELNRICMRGEPVNDRYVLRDGLRTLAELWGLTGANAVAQRRLKSWMNKDAKPLVREDMHTGAS